MAKNKSKSKSSATAASQGSGLNKLLLVLGLLTALLSSVVYFVEQNLNQFYIFDLDHLDDLSKRAIAKHGEDTRSVVQYIVTELNEKVPEHINLKEEWVFNNAGGAMGAMYIIHASVTEYLIIFGIFVCCNCISIANILSNRHCHRYRGSHWSPHRRRLLPHPFWNSVGLRPWRVQGRGVSRRQHPPPSPRRCQAIQDARGLLRARVRSRLDPSHALLWLCRRPVQHPRLPYPLGYHSHHWSRDDQQLAQGQAVRKCLGPVETDDLQIIGNRCLPIRELKRNAIDLGIQKGLLSRLYH